MVYKLLKEFKGAMCVMVTPFKKNGDVDIEQLKSFTTHLVDKGVRGLSMVGSTGEFYALSEKERLLVVKTVIDAAKGKALTIPGVGAMTTKEAINYAKSAEDLGADAVLLPPPYYFVLNPRELKGYFEEVVSSIEIPVVLYNAPAATGNDITPELANELSERFDNVKYVKESCLDIVTVHKTVNLKGVTVFAGLDHMVLPMLGVGCKGFMVISVNIIPELMVSLWNYFEKGEMKKALELHNRLYPLFELVTGGGPDIHFVQYAKEAMNLLGMNVGAPRKPLLPLDEARREQLRKTLESILGRSIPKKA